MKINALLGSVTLGLAAANALTDKIHIVIPEPPQLSCDHTLDETDNRDGCFRLAYSMLQAPLSGVVTLNKEVKGDVFYRRDNSENLVGYLPLKTVVLAKPPLE